MIITGWLSIDLSDFSQLFSLTEMYQKPNDATCYVIRAPQLAVALRFEMKQ